MTSEPQYQTQRLIFSSLCIILMLGGFYKACVNSNPVISLSNNSHASHAALVPQSQAITPPASQPTASQPKRSPAITTKPPQVETHSSPAEEPPTQVPPKPTWKITPISPSSGLPSDVSMTMQQCHHDGDTIQCSGFISISTDIATEECFTNSGATDDLGHQFNINPLFSGGGRASTLIPMTKYRFEIDVADPHPAVQNINFIIPFHANCNKLYSGRQSEIIFTNVPVQK